MAANENSAFSGPSPQPGSILANKSLNIQDDRFRFTPVKVAKSAPRVWDRKPSTAFLGRSKSRKVWKRFRSSFNSMKALQQMIAAENYDADNDLYTEINASRNVGLSRGVKRRCILTEDTEAEDGNKRARSFLETKWESLAGGRRRKLAAQHRGLVDTSGAMASDGLPDEPNQNKITPRGTKRMADTSSELQDEHESVGVPPTSPTKSAPDSTHHPRTLQAEPSCLPNGVEDSAAVIKSSPDVKSGLESNLRETDDLVPGGEAPLEETMKHDREQLEQQPFPSETAEDQVPVPPSPAAPPGAPVQDLTAEQESTLVRSALRSSLDGEDAELLNNFLSKAKAKREAKAAAAIVTEDAEDMKEEEKSPPQESEVVEFPTPPPRRALEDLDANSPSPQKPQQVSPTKGSVDRVASEENQPASSPRRSNRVRTPKQPPKSVTPSIRNTFSLRRSRGNEFVFLPRTEAQELALATRRNTRQNKGDSVLPKYALPKLSQTKSNSNKASPALDNSKSADKNERSPNTRKKNVSWNEDNLAQFEGGSPSSESSDQPSPKKPAADKRKTSSSRSNSTSNSSKSSQPTAKPAAPEEPAKSTPKTRRVRRLGAPKPADTSLDPTASPPPFSLFGNTSPSSDSRKKLTPRSPKSGLTGTRSSSLRSSTAAKSANVIQSTAGSTPVARKVRSRP